MSVLPKKPGKEFFLFLSVLSLVSLLVFVVGAYGLTHDPTLKEPLVAFFYVATAISGAFHLMGVLFLLISVIAKTRKGYTWRLFWVLTHWSFSVFTLLGNAFGYALLVSLILILLFNHRNLTPIVVTLLPVLMFIMQKELFSERHGEIWIKPPGT